MSTYTFKCHYKIIITAQEQYQYSKIGIYSSYSNQFLYQMFLLWM